MSTKKSLCNVILTACLTAAFATPNTSHALDITPSTDPDTLAAVLFPGTDGLIYTPGTAILDGFAIAGEGTSSGTFTNASGTYGIGNGTAAGPEGIILSSGAVEFYGDGPNLFFDQSLFFSDGLPAPAEQQALLFPITFEPEHYDATQLTIPFNNTSDSPQPLNLTAVFGSEEFPDFVGSIFNDGFGVYLNDTNIAVIDGLPANINHPSLVPVIGTELDAVIAPLGPEGFDPRNEFSGTANPGPNTLTIIIADASDLALDSTAYLSRDAITGPVAGVPLLPDVIDPDTGAFVFDGINAPAGEPVIIDPDVAIGYDYQAFPSADTPDPLFASVLIPPTTSATSFLISYGSIVDQPIHAGIALDLTIEEPGGVGAFTITGIPAFDLIPPDSPLGFVTTVTFTTDVVDITVTQTPITTFFEIPEPTTATAIAVFTCMLVTTHRPTRRA